MNGTDPTENYRRQWVAENNAAVESDDETKERARLEAIHGKGNVWDTQELQELFSVRGFKAPVCTVTRRSDGQRGAVEFQHRPRFYFNFTPMAG